MCGRAERPSSREIMLEMKALGQYEFKLNEEFPEHKNLAPSLGIPVITQNEPDLVKLAHWGVIPSYSKEFKSSYSTFNAKCENLYTLNTWKPLIEKKHCVVVVKS